MAETLYSIRMHASRDGHHLSGAERLVDSGSLEETASTLLRRALEHPRGRAEEVRLSVEALCRDCIRRGALPELTTVQVKSVQRGREAASHFLEQAGVRREAIRKAMSELVAGPAPDGRSMRGAMLVDAATGDRLEPDRARGIRVSRMDLASALEAQVRERLRAKGLDNSHVREAWTLAAKVLMAPGIVAELCWSDDPDYTAGYVAAPAFGYLRFPLLKPLGEEKGGRAFFIHSGTIDRAPLIEFLERAPVLFTEMGTLRPDLSWRES